LDERQSNHRDEFLLGHRNQDASHNRWYSVSSLRSNPAYHKWKARSTSATTTPALNTTPWTSQNLRSKRMYFHGIKHDIDPTDHYDHDALDHHYHTLSQTDTDPTVIHPLPTTTPDVSAYAHNVAFAANDTIPAYVPFVDLTLREKRSYLQRIHCPDTTTTTATHHTCNDAFQKWTTILFDSQDTHTEPATMTNSFSTDASDIKLDQNDDVITNATTAAFLTKGGCTDTTVPAPVQDNNADNHDPENLTIDQIEDLYCLASGFGPTPITHVINDCIRNGLIHPGDLLSKSRRSELRTRCHHDRMKTDSALIHQTVARSWTAAKKLDTWEQLLAPAHEREFQKLHENHVFEEVPYTKDIDPRTVVDSFLNYTIVFGPDLSIEKAKCRFLAKGFKQQENHSYFETAAATPFDTSWRILLSICGHYGWPIMHHDDVDTAFLTASLRETIYLRMPPDLRKRNADGIELIARLLKSIYGLKQSARAFQDKVARTFADLGYERSKFDSCVYYKIQNKNGSPRLATTAPIVDDPHTNRIPTAAIFPGFDPEHHDAHICVVHVDDILSVSSSTTMYNEWRTNVLKTFGLSGGTEAKWYLNMELTRNLHDHTITVGQRTLTKSLAMRFPWLTDARPVSTPLIDSATFNKSDCPTPAHVDRKLQEDFRSGLGILLYLSCKTRMDLAQSCAAASRVMSNAGPSHWKHLEHMLRYTYTTMDRTLVLGGTFTTPQSDNALVAYTDSDWGGDKELRCSTSGGLAQYLGNLIWWKSRLQATVSKSTCQAELIACSAAGAEVVHIRNFLAEIGFPPSGPTVLLCDNVGSIATAENPVISQRLKHLELADLWIREAVTRRKISVSYINTSKNPADCLTKSLGRLLHKRFVGRYYTDAR
jgi:hypothetical protein